MKPELLKLLEKNLSDTLKHAFIHGSENPALLIYDEQSSVAKILSKSYQNILPQAQCLIFESSQAEKILEQINQIPPHSLVVLIQSTSFRLNEFRFRIELFKRNLKVLEHVHLGRISEEEFPIFVDSMAYDPDYYRTLGPRLKKKMDACKTIRLIGPNSELIYDSPFEDSKLNIGDYSQMKNVGGQFPIGEVFSEAKNLHAVNGSLELFAYGGNDFDVIVPAQSFQIKVENGIITDASHAPEDFKAILEKVKEHEGKVWIRELGFGLNRAFTKARRVTDIGTYERMCGIHISMGAKHAMYTKEGFPKKQCKYHIDIFPDVKKVLIDEEAVFEDEKYII